MIYAKCTKRALDFLLSTIALLVLSPLIVLLIIIGAVAVKGNPFFAQDRPGRNEKMFKLIKFRTMTNERGEKGEYLPDDVRLIPYGRFLRKTSLDGRVIIGQTTESLENKGFREVSPILFHSGFLLNSYDAACLGQRLKWCQSA